MVGSAGNAPVVGFRLVYGDTGFTDRQPDHFPKVAGVGVAPTMA